MALERKTVRERLFWTYANLAMAHSAVSKQQSKYNQLSFMIRAKLYKGLTSETMSMRTLFDDERLKLTLPRVCAYCGSTQNLSLDHIVPKKLGGLDTGDNLVFCCKPCNSSKCSSDLLEWMNRNEKFPPLLVLRRYLKLMFAYCEQNQLLDQEINEGFSKSLLFRFDLLPTSFPKPQELVLFVESNEVR